MTTPSQQTQTNLLLRQFSKSDYDRLSPEFEALDASHGFCVSHAHEPVRYVYFPQSGLTSMTSRDDPMRVEIGIVGAEGMVGIPVVLGTETSPVSTFVQMPGAFLRVPAQTFAAFMRDRPAVTSLLLRFVQASIVQVSSTAIANATFNVEQRLARWLLMAHDRSDEDRLVITHDFLSTMLGVRRPGVTVATHVLEGEHAIKASRGAILITDRDKLKEFAAGSYGVAEDEYERLIGVRATKTWPRGDAEHASNPAERAGLAV